MPTPPATIENAEIIDPDEFEGIGLGSNVEMPGFSLVNKERKARMTRLAKS